MALIGTGEKRAALRRVAAGGLRLLADWIRPEDDVVDDGPSEAPVASAPADDEPERFGAAAYVDEHQGAPVAAEPEPPVDLMAALSGDVGPAIAARTRAANEQATGGDIVADPTGLRAKVIDALHTIYDPEIPVDIYELGLIYAVDVDHEGSVAVQMTLTSPNCPAAQSLPSEVEFKVSETDGVHGATVEVVFDPPWTPDLMSEEAKLELNIA